MPVPRSCGRRPPSASANGAGFLAQLFDRADKCTLALQMHASRGPIFVNQLNHLDVSWNKEWILHETLKSEFGSIIDKVGQSICEPTSDFDLAEAAAAAAPQLRLRQDNWAVPDLNVLRSRGRPQKLHRAPWEKAQLFAHSQTSHNEA